MGITAAILIPTGLLWLAFYACLLEDHERKNLPAGIKEFAKYFLLCLAGAIAVYAGCTLIFFIAILVVFIRMKFANALRGIIQFFIGR
jgi:hypothetical protein